ncbi:MAG: ROK family protein, partial [Chthonomonadaceae bacterium]|nr:ROK family protein [Chthonomonadaceae bacterium]
MTKEIGVDIGGTKLEAVVLEGSRPLVRKRCATHAEEGYEKILDRVVTLVHDVATEADVRTPCKIGVGAPGSMRPDGTMKNCNTQCLNGRELRSDLGQLLGIQVALANDADCFALAESTMGSGTGFRTVFGVIMGTGV